MCSSITMPSGSLTEQKSRRSLHLLKLQTGWVVVWWIDMSLQSFLKIENTQQRVDECSNQQQQRDTCKESDGNPSGGVVAVD
jgi:hypothetical protein